MQEYVEDILGNPKVGKRTLTFHDWKTDCNYPCHPKCRAEVPYDCPEVKTNWGKKILDSAKEREKIAATEKPTKLKTSLRESRPEEVNYEEDIPEVDNAEPESDHGRDTEPVDISTSPKPAPPLSSQPSLMRIAGGTKQEVAKTFEEVYDVLEKLGRCVDLNLSSIHMSVL